jgi:hypothetical protein
VARERESGSTPLPARFAPTVAAAATAAAATAATAHAATAAEAAATTAARLRTRFVHDERATIHLVFVELVDRLLRPVA